MRDLVIFGCGQVARTVAHYCERWGVGRVAAHVVDRPFLSPNAPVAVPVVALDELPVRFQPTRYAAFVAVGYQQMNAFRARKVAELLDLGFELVNVVNPDSASLVRCGRNCLVVPGATHIEPCVALGDDVFVWGDVSLSHYTTVGPDTWLSNGTVVGGNATIGRACMIGLNVTINDRVTIGDGCLVGSGAVVTRDLPDSQALIPPATPHVEIDSRYAQALLR